MGCAGCLCVGSDTKPAIASFGSGLGVAATASSRHTGTRIRPATGRPGCAGPDTFSGGGRRRAGGDAPDQDDPRDNSSHASGTSRPCRDGWRRWAPRAAAWQASCIPLPFRANVGADDQGDSRAVVGEGPGGRSSRPAQRPLRMATESRCYLGIYGVRLGIYS